MPSIINKGKKINVLISSAGEKIPLIRATQKALQRIDPSGKVIAGDLNASVLSSLIVDEFWKMPPTRDEFFDEILSEFIRHAIKIVVPTRDGELVFWAQHANILQKNGIHVIMSNQKTLERCLDKFEFSKFGTNNRYPFIPAFLRPDDFRAERYVVKERFGTGSRAIGIDLCYEDAKKHAQTLENPIFQPFVKGYEISIDAWLNKKNRVKGVVLRRRNLVINGESKVTTTFKNSAFEAQTKKVLEALMLSGPVMMQAIVDETENLHIIECNPRFGGASTASLAVGLDSLYWSFLEALGQDIDQIPFYRSQTELQQIRIPYDLHSDTV